MENIPFSTWMRLVDRKIQARAGVSVYDLADKPFREWYDDGMDPDEAVEEILEDEGFGDY